MSRYGNSLLLDATYNHGFKIIGEHIVIIFKTQ